MARCNHWFPWQQIGLQCEKRCHHIFSNVFDRIHFILAGNVIHKSLNEFEMRDIEKMTSSYFSTIFHLILFILAGNEDMHRSLDEFEIRPDPPLVSMATDRVTVGKTVSSHFLERFCSDSFHTCR